MDSHNLPIHVTTKKSKFKKWLTFQAKSSLMPVEPIPCDPGDQPDCAVSVDDFITIVFRVRSFPNYNSHFLNLHCFAGAFLKMLTLSGTHFIP